MKQLDYDDNGMINYHEFIQATFPVEKYLTPEKMNAIFAKFDVDASGEITVNNLKDAFTKLGHEITDQEIEEIFREHDVNGDMKITKDEFITMIKQNF